MRLINRRKNSEECFGFFVKNYKNIEHPDFVNVNIALNLHYYEEN